LYRASILYRPPTPNIMIDAPLRYR
jgi:hypothetical protein